MNSKRIKIIAIVVILIIDIIFLSLIISGRISENNYDKNKIDNLYLILNNSNLRVDEKTFSGRKVRIDSYSSSYTLDDIMNLVIRVYSGVVITKTNDSISFSYNEGEWMITKESYVEYVNNQYENEDFDNLTVVNKYDLNFVKLLKQAILYNNISKDKINKKSNKLDISISNVYKTENDNYYVVFNQTVNGYSIDNSFEAVFKGDKLLYIKGDLLYIFPENYLKAENASLIDIIIDEKRRVQDYDKLHIVKDIIYSYNLYYDGYSTYYYIPVCKFVYEDGTISSYDYITGDNI